MKILFTGHRDCACEESVLIHIHNKYPDAEWIHGGTNGFDTQVEQFAQTKGIKSIIFSEEAKSFGQFTLVQRMDSMVKNCDRVVALWDGRSQGGTRCVIGKARSAGKLVYLIPQSKIKRLKNSIT
jgi:hypothetical protein